MVETVILGIMWSLKCWGEVQEEMLENKGQWTGTFTQSSNSKYYMIITNKNAVVSHDIQQNGKNLNPYSWSNVPACTQSTS